MTCQNLTMCRISLFQAKQYQTWTSATSQKIWKNFSLIISARVWLMATIILSSLVIFFRMEPQKLKVQNNQSWCLFIVLIRFFPFADWYQEDIKTMTTTDHVNFVPNFGLEIARVDEMLVETKTITLSYEK